MAPSRPLSRTNRPLDVRRAVLAVVAVVTLAAASAGCSDDAGDDRSADTTTSIATTSTTAATTTSDDDSEESRPAARPSAGCDGSGNVAGGATTTEETTDDAGRPRTYTLAVPADVEPDEPMPMVLALHGALGSAAQFDESTDLVARGTDRGYVVALPDAVDGSWDYGLEGPDDAFLTGIVDHVTATHCVDLDRIHLTGMSLGAWKSAITACANPGTFTSLVLVTVEVRPEGCEPLPVLAVHGTSDHMAPYGEGGEDVEIISGLAGLSGTRDNAAAWAEGAGCDPTWTEHRIEPDVVRWVYEGCDDGLGVELYTIEGGDHAWPGSPRELALTTDAIHATDVALDWFDAHSRSSAGR